MLEAINFGGYTAAPFFDCLRRPFNEPGVVLWPAPLIVERYERWASPDRIGPVQDPVCAKYVVAWWIAVDRAGFIRKELPPDLDPEAACGRPAPRAEHVVGRGHETARRMTVGSTLFCVRACGRFGHSASRRARQCQQCRHADHASMMLRAVAQGQDILPMNSLARRTAQDPCSSRQGLAVSS